MTVTLIRSAAIRNLAVGDIFHAKSGNHASLICLVTSVTNEIIDARTVTTQLRLRFNRKTGVAAWGDDKLICTIDSTAPLPPEVKGALLGLDERYRLGTDPDRARSLDAEKRELIFVATFYPPEPARSGLEFIVTKTALLPPPSGAARCFRP